MHASDRARIEREVHNRKLQAENVSQARAGSVSLPPLTTEDTPAAAEEVAALGVGPKVRPGSVEEERALERIAELRYADRAAIMDTPASRRKRHERYWSKRGTT